jgi:aminopeptidase-like protein
MSQNLNPKCEPQLGKRGIYRLLGGQNNDLKNRQDEFALFWVLNLSDGTHSISDIVEISGFDQTIIKNAVEILIDKKLLVKI